MPPDEWRGPEDERALEELLSEPTPGVVSALGKLGGDLVVLGAGGKMGLSLAAMAVRAFRNAGVPHQVWAVSRFSDPGSEARLAAAGARPVRCDLLERSELAALPDAPHVAVLTGFKFGTRSNPGLTWATNCLAPALLGERYRASRLVAFSSGNVYGYVSPNSGGSRETDPPRPLGEYASATVGRERIYQYISERFGTSIALLRLNYAHELRYGVLVDLAQAIRAGRPIDLAMGYVNVLWQADANAMALQSFPLAASPVAVLNLAGPEVLHVGTVALELGRRLGIAPQFVGAEEPDALLNNGQRALELFGPPRVTAEQLIGWVADWVAAGNSHWDRPTRYEVRDGQF